MYLNNIGFIQNRNRKIKETITWRIQRFRWFGFWPTSIGRVEEKVSLIKERDYKGSTKTLSQNPNPKYTQRALNHQKHVTKKNLKFSRTKSRLRTLYKMRL